MASINTVKSATDTATVVDDNVLNPTSTNTVGVRIVHVTLKFKDVDFVPNDLHDALNAQWGTVASDKPFPSHNIFEFTVSA